MWVNCHTVPGTCPVLAKRTTIVSAVSPDSTVAALNLSAARLPLEATSKRPPFQPPFGEAKTRQKPLQRSIFARKECWKLLGSAALMSYRRHICYAVSNFLSHLDCSGDTYIGAFAPLPENMIECSSTSSNPTPFPRHFWRHLLGRRILIQGNPHLINLACSVGLGNGNRALLGHRCARIQHSAFSAPTSALL